MPVAYDLVYACRSSLTYDPPNINKIFVRALNPIVGLDITLLDHMNQELIVVLFELSGWLFILVVCLFKIVMHNATYFVNSIFWQCDIQWRYFLFPPNEATPLIKRVSTKRYATYQPTVFPWLTSSSLFGFQHSQLARLCTLLVPSSIINVFKHFQLTIFIICGILYPLIPKVHSSLH